MPTSKLFKADLDGENIVQLRDLGDSNLEDLLFYEKENLLFWSESNADLIKRYDLTNDDVETIIGSSFGDSFEGLSIKPAVMSSLKPSHSVEKPQLALYPNPATDVLYVNGLANFNNVIAVKINSIDGQLIMQKSMIQKEDQVIINIDQLGKGNYIMILINKQKHIIQSYPFQVIK